MKHLTQAHEWLIDELPELAIPTDAKKTDANFMKLRNEGLIKFMFYINDARRAHVEYPNAVYIHRDTVRAFLGQRAESLTTFRKYFIQIGSIGNSFSAKATAYKAVPHFEAAAKRLINKYTDYSKNNKTRPEVKEFHKEIYAVSLDGEMAAMFTSVETNIDSALDKCVEVEELWAPTIMFAHYDELTGAKELAYFERDARLYHPLQSIPKVVRKVLFKGWIDYDIEAAAPTILSQMVSFDTPMIKDYIENKAARREEMAKFLNIEVEDAKAIITSAFFGSCTDGDKLNWDVGNNTDLVFGLSKIFDKYRETIGEKIYSYRRFSWFIELASEIAIVYKELSERAKGTAEKEDGDWIITNDSGASKNIGKRWSSRVAVGFLYFSMERKVLNIANHYMKSKNAQSLLIHDGFIVNQELDLEVLTKRIKATLNLDIKFSKEVL